MHEHAVAVGDRRDDACGDVVLHREHARRLEVPTIGLGPEPRSRPGVDELGADAKVGASATDASLHHVARPGPWAWRPVVSLGRLVTRRAARDDRQIPKPREAAHDLLGEPVGQGQHVRVGGAALERPHGDLEPGWTDRRRDLRCAARRGRRRELLRKTECDVPGRLESTLAVLLEAVFDDPLERRGDVSPRLRELGRLPHQDRRHRLGVRVSLERLPAREQLVENRPEREDVRTVIDREPFHLLGRHVAHRPHDHPGLRVARARRGARLLALRDGLDPLRQPEVEDLEMAVSRNEEVLGLQVPVDDALLMGGGESLRDLQCVVHGLLLRNLAGVELSAQRLPFQKLHDGVGDPVLVSEVVDREDVLMGEGRDRLRLALEPGQRVGIRCDGLGQDLDRDVAIQLLVPRPIDLPHPARTEGRRGSRRGRGASPRKVSSDGRGNSIPRMRDRRHRRRTCRSSSMRRSAAAAASSGLRPF